MVAYGCTTPYESPPTTGDGGASNAAYTLDNVCVPWAERMCASRAVCCRGVVRVYDDLQCIEYERQQCELLVEGVRQGQVTFRPDHVDACLEEAERFYLQCSYSFVRYFWEVYDLRRVCSLAFEGPSPIGGACTASVDCAADDEALFCDEDTSSCIRLVLRDEGEPCAMGTELCGPGLYCAFDGVCHPTIPEGGECGHDPVACGDELHCVPDVTAEERCLPKDVPGAACTTGATCLSGECHPDGYCTIVSSVGLTQCTGLIP